MCISIKNRLPGSAMHFPSSKSAPSEGIGSICTLQNSPGH
jgi:hypothetical protein